MAIKFGKKDGKSGTTLKIPAVGSLDYEKFEGRWFELARLPLPVAKDWVETSETYTRKPDGSWRVSYDGLKGSASGPAKSMKLSLRVPDPSHPGEMEASFIPFVWMKYRIVYMSADARFMLVTGKSMRHLWLMCRERIPGDKEYKNLVWRAREMGFEVDRLEKVSQGRN